VSIRRTAGSPSCQALVTKTVPCDSIGYLYLAKLPAYQTLRRLFQFLFCFYLVNPCKRELASRNARDGNKHEKERNIPAFLSKNLPG
jgi:hypothetical protein